MERCICTKDPILSSSLLYHISACGLRAPCEIWGAGEAGSRSSAGQRDLLHRVPGFPSYSLSGIRIVAVNLGDTALFHCSLCSSSSSHLLVAARQSQLYREAAHISWAAHSSPDSLCPLRLSHLELQWLLPEAGLEQLMRVPLVLVQEI